MSEYVLISKELLEKVIKYALTHCYERCPSERDAETCVLLFELIEKLNLALQLPCIYDYGGFSEKIFRDIIKDIEHRRGKKLNEIIKDFKTEGFRTLKDQEDYIDGVFAMQVVEVYKKIKTSKKLRFKVVHNRC
ncbi:MAG: hypothetical protein DRJ52_00355 [Thermoprotei archaeon]|nr:MAG: hypothetical protein DRJ52_00355 [Thermoprotei archaeon]RLF00298.1 MAG: hypothetical protein DRJ63_02880 [Thermoprotei archaeon]